MLCMRIFVNNQHFVVMNANKIFIAIILALILVIILQSFKSKKFPDVELLKVDTVEIVKVVEKVEIRKAKPKIIYKHDTIYQTKGFVAHLDTIIQKDTIKASYEFPENYLDLQIMRSSDTFRLPSFRFTLQKEKKTWLDYAPAFIIGTVVGFVLGKTK